tara:strand:+ start:2564 stop:3403 length:840 start_codon:yes stop_codon:yes gene_type:complete
VPDRFKVQVGAIGTGDVAGEVGEPGGLYWLHLFGFGQFQVRISHLDDTSNQLILSEPLPVGIPSDASGTLYHNDWRATLSSDELGTAIDRSGYYLINYTIDDAPLHDIGTRTKTERGRLRVVRASFETGLSSNDLLTLVPQLEATRPANREGWQPYIERYDIIGEIEALLPSNRFADMALGEQFRRAHALFVAASLAEIGYAPNVDPEKMRTAADAELRRQLSRIHWLDLDNDAAVDDAEKLLNSERLVAITRSSNSETKKDYDDQKRFRPVLNNADDR